MTKFEEYVEVYNKIKELEKKKEDLQIELFDEIDAEGQTYVENKFGGFYIMGRKTYDYSDNVKMMQRRLAQIKKQEEAQGIALLKSHSQHIRYLSPEMVKKNKEEYFSKMGGEQDGKGNKS